MYSVSFLPFSLCYSDIILRRVFCCRSDTFVKKIFVFSIFHQSDIHFNSLHGGVSSFLGDITLLLWLWMILFMLFVQLYLTFTGVTIEDLV